MKRLGMRDQGITTPLGWLAGLLVGAIALAAGCNHTPVESLDKSLTLKVIKGSDTADPVKIDFLWIVDNSSSMCEEQAALFESFDDFVERLESSFQIDPRVAVASIDVDCEPNLAERIASTKGVFNTVPNKVMPVACQEQRARFCREDVDCGNLDCVIRGECAESDTECTCDPLPGRAELGMWECAHSWAEAELFDLCAVNPNGSINTSCIRRCDTDDDCQQLFDDSRYVCRAATRGCVLEPDRDFCPDTVPAVLDSSNLHLFPCNASVGLIQRACFRFEQGLAAALMALDPSPTAPNSEQARDFHRDDAYLVIIIISDEDDCSLAQDGFIDVETQRDTCALLPTSDQGGPLAPVGHYINRFKSLRSDPGRVIVATISGDSLETDPAAIAADRQAFIESKGHPRTCHQQSYICLSDIGKSDYGARYIELADGFGPNGVFTNLCEAADMSRALGQIAETIIQVLNRMCLPKPIIDRDSLLVERTRDGETELLFEGDGPGMYRIVEGAEECAIGGRIMPAIAFGDPPSPGEEIRVTYQGDPLLP